MDSTDIATNTNRSSTNNVNGGIKPGNWLRKASKATSNVIQQAKQSRMKKEELQFQLQQQQQQQQQQQLAVSNNYSKSDDGNDSNNNTAKLWGISNYQPSITINNDNNTSLAPSSSDNVYNYDDFSFAPLPPNFIPISSCDELTPIEPPDLDPKSKANNELKLSSNFSTLIANAKKVDQVRNRENQQRMIMKARQQQEQSQTNSNNNMILTSTDADEFIKNQLQVSNSNDENNDNDNHDDNNNDDDNNDDENKNLSVQQVQSKLIEQLKQGLDFLTNQNKMLSSRSDALEKQIIKDRHDFDTWLQRKQKEVEERNLKLAILEQTFVALNNPTRSGTSSSTSASTSHNTDSNTSIPTSQEMTTAVTSSSEIDIQQVVDGDDNETKSQSSDHNDLTNDHNEEITKENDVVDTTQTIVQTSLQLPPPLPQHTVSSIVQIDKGYFTDLEKTVTLQKRAIETLEKENADLTEKVTSYTSDLEMKERTITNLESSLKQAHETRFKKSTKSRRHKKTQSLIISTTSITTEANHPQSLATPSSTSVLSQSEDDDEFSISNASATTMSISVDEKDKQQDVDVQIEEAINDALEKQEKEHKSTMDVLSRQLDIKDKIIKRHEMKIYDLLHRKDGGQGGIAKAEVKHQQRHIPQDVMVRNIAVTNELMDTSIRKLEKMMDQLELIQTKKRTDLVDEISPIRKVGTKVTLVHEEMKVAIKLIELKVKNDLEKIKQSTEEGNDDNEIDKDKSRHNSDEGEGRGAADTDNAVSQKTINDRIDEVLSQTMNALKETENTVKSEIESLTEKLQQIEFDLAEKQDTIEALELACSEHVENSRKMQEEIEQLKMGLAQV